jgi:hypothetical protein
MCVDYMGLNKACPKDPFPLPRIDQVVNSTAGCETVTPQVFIQPYLVVNTADCGQITVNLGPHLENLTNQP